MEPLYNGNHWDQRFCPSNDNEVSLAQGVIVDHAPFTIAASYAGERHLDHEISCRLLIKDLFIFIILVALRHESREAISL